MAQRKHTKTNVGSRSRQDSASGFSSLLKSQMSSREGLVLLLFIAVALLIFGRLFLLTVVDAQALAREGQEKRTLEYDLTARRGTVFDRNGNVLATSVEATTIYANPSEIKDPAQTASALAQVLGGSLDRYLQVISADSKSTFVYIAKKSNNATAEKLQDLDQEYREQIEQEIRARGDDVPAEIQTPLSGIHYLPDSKREYPYGQIGSQIIGAVNDENVGISGIEQTYDSILRGIDGKMVVQKGKALSEGQDSLPIIDGVQEQVAAIDGQDIIISLDIDMQQYLEYNLQALSAQRNCANADTLLLDGATGEIIAGASMPLYSREKVSDEDVAGGATTLKSITQAYEPGSIFKVCVAATLLENNLMQAENSLFCPAALTIYDATIKDAVERSDATYTLRQIIAKSSNVGASLLEAKAGDERFSQSLDDFGFGQFSHVDYPGETSGLLADLEDWNPVQAANLSFGQGLQVSSLQMASLYGAIANDGLLIQPHFLLSRPQYDSVLDYDSRQILKPTTARDLEELLRAVVTEGTGSAAGLEGLDVVGKTGTAEKASEAGGYLTNNYNISFVGYIDNCNSKYTFISRFDNPTNYQSSPAAQLFSIVMAFAANRYMITPQEEANPAAVVALAADLAEASAAKSDPEESENAAPQATTTAKPESAVTENNAWNLDTSG